MGRFSYRRESEGRNICALLSAVFLASRGDKDAVNLFKKTIRKRNIDSFFDSGYLIQIVGMTHNDTLLNLLREIILTDKRERWYGEDCVPQKQSFRHGAALSCYLALEGFPEVFYYEKYDDEKERVVLDWLKSHPKNVYKKEVRLFFWYTPIQSFFSWLYRDYRKRFQGKMRKLFLSLLFACLGVLVSAAERRTRRGVREVLSNLPPTF